MRAITCLTLAIVALLLPSCGVYESTLTPVNGPPGAPFEGRYELTVRAADRCGLPVSEFRWRVVARTKPTESNWAFVQVSLEGENSSFLEFFYHGAEVEQSDFSTFNRGLAVAGHALRVQIQGAVLGPVERFGPVSVVRDGSLGARIQLFVDDPAARPGLEQSVALCEAQGADHTWRLVPR